jgi:hypothetical protein
MFSGREIIENYRPKWLIGTEIDFWLPELELGFEFDGDQHHIPVYGIENLIAQMERDNFKRMACNLRGVLLISIDASKLSLNLVYREIWMSLTQVFLNMGDEESKKIAFEYRARIADRPIASHKIDQECRKYREHLKEVFFAPSAHRRQKDRAAGRIAALSIYSDDQREKVRLLKRENRSLKWNAKVGIPEVARRLMKQMPLTESGSCTLQSNPALDAVVLISRLK